MDSQPPPSFPGSPSFQADSSSAVHWRPFLRALIEEIDSLTGVNEREEMLRGVGRRMARILPLTAVGSLESLELEINDTLETIGWGSVQLSLNEGQRSLIIAHTGLPRIGSAGSPPGTWLAALLEGLYETWLAQQPGSDPNLTIRREASATASPIILRFGRG
jgi:hypothetical protein